MRKRILYLYLAALMALYVSCSKDNKPNNEDDGKYGVDGKTPMLAGFNYGVLFFDKLASVIASPSVTIFHLLEMFLRTKYEGYFLLFPFG